MNFEFSIFKIFNRKILLNIIILFYFMKKVYYNTIFFWICAGFTSLQKVKFSYHLYFLQILLKNFFFICIFYRCNIEDIIRMLYLSIIIL
jgi:hypothetical protein